MCKILEDMVKEAEARGEARGEARAEAAGMADGIIQLGRDMNLTDEQIAGKLVSLCNISREAAEKLLKPSVA